jgi:predicted O-methyltransferase YrrM
MKAKLDAIIQHDQAEYLEQLLTQSDPLLVEMEAYAAEHRVPIADREVARFLEITARVTGARKALEIGMARLISSFFDSVCVVSVACA